MIKAIIFDFFGVLVSSGLDTFYDEYCKDKATRSRAKLIVREYNSGLGGVGYQDVVEQLAQLTSNTEAQVRNYLDSHHGNLGLINFISSRLKGKYKLGILSNSGDDYARKFLKSDDIGLFDDIVLSYKHGVTKPDPAIFRLAASRLGMELQECVLIDDSAIHCRAAKAVGMQAILYQDFGQMKTALKKLPTFNL